MGGCPPDAAELACIREDVADMVCDTPCTISRPVVSDDAYGSQDEASLTTIASLKVGLTSISKGQTQSQLQPFMHLIGSYRAWLVQFPWDTNVLSGDYLDFGAHPLVGSDPLVVQALLPSSYDALIITLATCVK